VRGRQKKFFIFVFLVAAILLIAGGVYRVLQKTGEKPGRAKGKEIKRFSFSSAGELKAWDEKTLSQHGTDYSVTNFDGKNCVKAVSENSASTLYYKQTLSCKARPFIKWDWKAEKFPAKKHKEALDEKEEFDFVAQVYVVFYARFFLNAKAIQYVWTRDLPVGDVSASPYTKNVKLLVLESGESETWKHEERDIKKDFKELFGEELDKDITAISFMTDSDSAKSSAVAYYSDIAIGYLEGAPPVPEAEDKGKTDLENKKRKEPSLNT